MAESADVLCSPHQQVILPGPGGRMLDGRHGRARAARIMLGRADADGIQGVVPVTYINSAASIKSFVGERGGTVCTSSNAMATLKWGLLSGREDSVPAGLSYLGRIPRTRWASRSTRCRVGSGRDLWRSSIRTGAALAKMILWKGHCSFHTRFTAKQIEALPSSSILASA
jgi:quinolinate synthase